MKGKCTLKCVIWCFSAFDVFKPHKQCVSMRILFTVITFLYLVQLSKCQSVSQTITIKIETENEISPAGGYLNSSSVSSNSEADYSSEYYYEEEYNSNSTANGHLRRRGHDKSKTAQVIVYLSVIFIALGGILIKYFVTEFETSQIKAQEQLSYHRLHNQAA